MTVNRKIDPTSNGYGDHPSSQDTQRREAKKRPMVGFLTAHIHLPVTVPVWASIVNAAQNHDVNLICFPGETLPSSKNLAMPQNVLYDLVNPEQFDGLISWASTVGQGLTSNEIADFHQRYQPLPLVTLTQPVKGAPTLFANTYLGMREVMIHLIEVHGYRRLAFLHGPEGHSYAQERYRAYVDVLKEHDIPLSPELVTPPLLWDEGAKGIQILLDERQLRPKVDFEVLVAANDQLALSAFKVLQARGIRVPEEVALTGFDDTPDGRVVSPSLTSVMMPFAEQGERAIEVLLAQLAGKPVAEQIAVAPQLVVRQSCGCPSQLVMQAVVGSKETPNNQLIGQSNLDSRTWLETKGRIPEEMMGWVAQLRDALIAELNGAGYGRFLLTLERLLRQAAAKDGDVIAWQGVISTLRGLTLPDLTDGTRLHAEDLWGQARVLISEMAQQTQAHQQLEAKRLTERLRDLGQALIAALDIATVMKTLAERLPTIGIPSCYLSLYEQPEAPLEQARLVLAYNEQGRIELEPEGQCFPTQQLAPEGLLPQGRRYSMVAEPLYFQEEQIGFVLFEIGPPDGTIYEVLREQISSALHNILMNQQREQAKAEIEAARLEAEQALAELQTIQHRYLQEAWQKSTHTAGAIQGYVYSPAEAGPAAEAWLPAMTTAVQQMQTVNQDEAPTGTSLALPVKVYNEIIGVLGFSRQDAAQWSEREIAIVETIVEQVGLALENQRLFDEVQQTSRLLDKRITELDCLNDIGHEMGEASSVAQFLQWVTGRIPTAMQYPDLCLVAIEFEGQIYGAAEALSLPCQMVHGLRSSSEAFGRIYIAYTEKHDFLNEESALLGDIARRVSVYIESSRLLVQTQQRALETENLYNAGRRISAAKDLQEVVAAVMEGIPVPVVNRAVLYIFEYSETDEMEAMVLLATWYSGVGTRPLPIGTRYPRAAFTAIGLLLNPEPLFFADVQHDERIKDPAILGVLQQQNIRAMAVLPLWAGARQLGVLLLLAEEVYHFTEGEIRPYLSLVGPVAVSVENKRLLEQAQTRARREQILREVTARVHTGTDVDTIMRTAAQEVGRALGRPAFVYLGHTEKQLTHETNGSSVEGTVQ